MVLEQDRTSQDMRLHHATENDGTQSKTHGLFLGTSNECIQTRVFQAAPWVKNLSACNAGDTEDAGSILRVRETHSPGEEDSLGESMATHSSTLAWRTP